MNLDAPALLQVLAGGLASGCVYGVVALSFVLIFKSTGVVSFMQGALLAAGAYAAVALHQALGWPALAALPGAVAASALLGLAMERLVLRRALGESHLTAVLLTYGLGLLVQGAIAAVPAANYGLYQLPLPVPLGEVALGPLRLAGAHLLVILATLVLGAALALFFRRTRAGLALRACAEDRAAASLMGVSPGATHALAWSLGAALAGAAGLLLAPLTMIQPTMGEIALKAFPAAVLGGLASLRGALAGGLLLGLAEAFAGLALPPGAKDMLPYALLLLGLWLFPQGLGGSRNR